jgi:hypothetical protein
MSYRPLSLKSLQRRKPLHLLLAIFSALPIRMLSNKAHLDSLGCARFVAQSHRPMSGTDKGSSKSLILMWSIPNSLSPRGRGKMD